MKLEYAIGPLTIKFTGKFLLILGRRRDGTHLTIPLEVWRGAPGKPADADAGTVRPHLTYPQKNQPPRRRFIARFRPEELRAFILAWLRVVLNLWLKATRPVDLASLEQEGWIATPMTDSAQAEYIKCLGGGRSGRIILEEDVLMDAFELMLKSAVLPTDLDAWQHLKRPVQAVRFDEDGNPVEGASLQHFPHGLGGPPGWYLTKYPTLDHDQIQDAFLGCVGPTFIRKMLEITRELRLGGDEAHMMRLLAIAEARRGGGAGATTEEHPLLPALMEHVEKDFAGFPSAA